ncbi:phospholipase D-like domain-containing protein [Novosphingobium sp. FKTRR1]|uniref:phospholipase D-like domain-containing protein n=1 Tax=Novosphingobium sp. FKTRR1 TaxID=2879118 RepID=UPI001CF0C126|nr:phospholipase D-like domain-containing protein [Novosphingobium sp. FKTRR1]
MSAEPSSPETADIGVSPSVWRYAHASRAHLIIDGAAYFVHMRAAMVQARQRILLIGWDFDTRILVGEGRRWWNLPRRKVAPARLGAFIMWLANRRPGLDVRLLKWNFGAMKALLRGTMVWDLLRWALHPRITYRLDSAHPLGCSHHQKIVVIDDKVAMCGGIDMTAERWDTREHREKDQRRRLPGGLRTFGPWHDSSLMLEGEAARALGDLGRQRWAQAGGKPLAPCLPQTESAWPNRVAAEFTDVEVGIARTRSAWRDISAVREVEALAVEQIGRAQRFIYAENQYFASRRIAEALAERLAEPDPPEVVVVMPLASHGWLQHTAMDNARARLFAAVKAVDHADRLSIWIPRNAAGTPIYVHAKLTIIDDEILRVGSANWNNRSMGLDTECDVFIDAQRPANAGCEAQIRAIRHSLLGEHCDLAADLVGSELDRHRSMAAMIAAQPANGRHLERYVPPELSEAAKVLADSALLDPEAPEEMLAFYRHRGLFRSRILKRPA